MRILFLTQIVPYPPDAGPRVKTWHVLRHLADAGHKVILATFMRPDEAKYIPYLKELCAEVHTVPMRRSRISDLGYLLLSYLKGTPFLIERDNSAAMHRIIEQLTAKHKVHLIHCDQVTMTQFGLQPRFQIPRIFDSHNATWKLVERSIDRYPFFFKIPLRQEVKRMKIYERKIISEFEHTFTVTSVDRDFFLELFTPTEQPQISAKITSTPISVDCDAINPVPLTKGATEIVTLGTLHYPPNADGIRWFLQEVFPLIQAQLPGVHLTVIGKNPPEDFLLEAQRIPDALTVTGYVPNLTPYFQKAALIVVPVRSGGGMRVRILEAFAYGLPVVTTSAGLEGIEAIPGQDVIVKNTPEEFASSVVEVINNADLQKTLAQNGRFLAEQKYHWKKALGMIDQVYTHLLPNE